MRSKGKMGRGRALCATALEGKWGYNGRGMMGGGVCTLWRNEEGEALSWG